MDIYKVGLDIGSTTAKIIVLDKSERNVLFYKYERHQAKVQECLLAFFHQLKEQMGDVTLSINITGSVGMGIAEKYSLPFVQEVVAAAQYIRRNHPGISSMIDIGGEDAKVVFFQNNQATDLRMNGNCAGGTGAFIDQMAILLGVSMDELNGLALRATRVHPIASRCGVFCKTDIQNLIAKNIPKEDIAASIFHAVTVQTIVTLAHGCDIVAPILLFPSIFKVAGYEMETLPISDECSCDWGLKYSNNEVCYPATLIVGDIVKAFKEGRYDPDNTCVAITQTGGQCRASNYISLIKKALIENGYTHTPILSIAFGSGIDNQQPGFKVNWLKVLPIALAAVLYSDCIAKFYYAAVVREKKPGQAAKLKDMYLEAAKPLILKNRPEDLLSYLSLAVDEFNQICQQKSCPKVGVVGEIFLKFNPFAQKDITTWLIDRGIEVVPPLMTDFFMQSFVNVKVNQDSHIKKKYIPDFAIDWLYGKVQKQIDKINKIGKAFLYFQPFENIYEKAEKAKQVISLNTQFGEGWLIAGEMSSFASQGINHVISLQPFGCIANHIVEKGIEKRIKSVYPQINILSLDFDSSVSDVNITNRLLLFVDNIK